MREWCPIQDVCNLLRERGNDSPASSNEFDIVIKRAFPLKETDIDSVIDSIWAAAECSGKRGDSCMMKTWGPKILRVMIHAPGAARDSRNN